MDNNSVDTLKDYKELLLKLGYTNEDLDAIGDEEIYNIMKDATRVMVIDSYVKVDVNGNVYTMDKNTCLQGVKQMNQENVNLKSSNDGSNYDASDDGYMRITTQATYLSNGYYYLSGNYQWLTIPSSRMTDSISVAAPDCAWVTGTSALYSTYYYKIFEHNGKVGTDETNTHYGSGSVSVESTGIHAEYDLPKDYDLVDQLRYGNVTNMSYYIRGKARVTNWTSSTAYNVFTRYEHVWSSVGVQPSFSWTTEGISANINVSLINNHKLYPSYCFVNYTP